MILNNKKKILYVCNDSSPYGSGKALLDIIDNLNTNNYLIYVLLPQDGPIVDELVKRKINYKIIKYYSWAINGKDYFTIKFLIKHFLNHFSLLKLKRVLDINDFDIIHSLNSCVYFGALISKKYNLRHIWHLREYNKEYAYKWYVSKKMKEAEKLICVSKAVYDHFYNKYDLNNMTIIYDGISIDNYKNSIIPPVNNKSYNLLMAGDICNNKGQHLAIKAVEFLIKNKAMDLNLYIAGNGDDENKLKNYVNINKLKKNIKFLGYVNNLNELRKSTNIYLMCSLKEAWGFVTIESMMAKNLVIGSNSGGTSEIIHNSVNGYLFEPGSWQDLAKKIEYSIKNWEKSKKIIEFAHKESIKKYSVKDSISNIEKLYNIKEGEFEK